MNSLVASFRAAVRAPTARTPSVYAAFRSYSAPSAPAAAADSPAPPPPSDILSSSTAADVRAGLDSVIKEIQASKPTPRAKPNPLSAYAHKGPAHRSLESFLNTSTPTYRTGLPASSVRPSTPEELWRRQVPVSYSLPVTTTSARSFAVVNRDVARAYRNLNRVMQENNVRRELKRQERFESPSNKRVRLTSERHRRRFKVAVGKAVALAMRMKDL
ncbi:hypothetical protein JCM8097_009325 [Rhodosporidiobolus ruineniae]